MYEVGYTFLINPNYKIIWPDGLSTYLKGLLHEISSILQEADIPDPIKKDLGRGTFTNVEVEELIYEVESALSVYPLNDIDYDIIEDALSQIEGYLEYYLGSVIDKGWAKTLPSSLMVKREDIEYIEWWQSFLIPLDTLDLVLDALNNDSDLDYYPYVIVTGSNDALLSIGLTSKPITPLDLHPITRVTEKFQGVALH